MGLFGPSKKEMAERAAREQDELERATRDRAAREDAERKRQEALRKEKEPIRYSLMLATNNVRLPEHLLSQVTDWESWSPDLVLDWLREQRKFIVLAQALEACGRFDEALALVEKLGPASYFEYFRGDGSPVRTGEYVNMGGVSSPLDWSKRAQMEAYERKVAQLRGHAAAAGVAAKEPRETRLKDLEDRYAYGEVTKIEYELLKTQLLRDAGRRCGSCGTPFAPAHNFCRRCGVQLPAEQAGRDHAPPSRDAPEGGT